MLSIDFDILTWSIAANGAEKSGFVDFRQDGVALAIRQSPHNANYSLSQLWWIRR